MSVLNLVFRLVLLALPFIAFTAWFESARGGRDTNLFTLKRRLLEVAAPRLEVLTLGSSHAHEGILPLLVHSNAFNLGAVSQSLYYDDKLVRAYAPRLPNLRLVVLPVSYFTLGYEIDQAAESWRTYYYRRYHGVPHRDWRVETHLRNFADWFLYGRDLGLAAVRGQKPEDIRGEYDEAGGHLDTRPPGERTPYPQPDHVRTSAAGSMERHHASMRTEKFAVNRARLEELLRWLRARKIEAVFVTLPVSPGYRSLEQPDLLARTSAALANVGREFGVAWHDFSADPRFVEDDFWDADHLNFTGAAKFSQLLGDEVVRPALAKSPGR